MGPLLYCGMEERSIFRNISPLDHRYYLSNPGLFDSLSDYLSEEAAVRYCAKAEVALMRAHLESRGLYGGAWAEALAGLAERVDPSKVYAEEEKTQHNVRALVNVLKTLVPEDLSPYVHLGATSVDILDTAMSLRVKDAVRRLILPLLASLERKLCLIAEREAETPQVGRTHGQHAVPISFGFAMAEYASRLGKSILRIEELSLQLCGKLAGAVGAYNALSMSYGDPEAVEARYLELLGLLPSEHSTQLVEPEYLLRVLLEINIAFGVVANLADDLRNLQRSEINEVRESFGQDQVGSSTMPHKRNPWNCEHVKSLWKAFAPRCTSFFMDQISEHQRDLTNSASQRFVADFLAGFAAAIARMDRVLGGLRVNSAQMLSNLRSGGGAVLAEPAYILLAEEGISDGHERIRLITLKAEREGLSFVQALAEDDECHAAVVRALARLGKGGDFFEQAENYRGIAAEKARGIAGKYQKAMTDMERRLGLGESRGGNDGD